MRRLMMLCELKPGTIDHQTSHPLQTTYIVPGFSNSNPYEQYRYGLALAAAMAKKENPDLEFDQASAFNINMTLTPYSDVDDEIIKLAAKLVGAHPKLINSVGSHEPDDTFTQSPVPKQKD